VAVAIVGLVLVGSAVFRFSPLWPGPSLPAGATRLNITTEAPHLFPVMGCPTALLVPARIVTSGDDLILRTVATDDSGPIVWPSGWVAWRLNGRAELLRRDGSLVGRDGDVLNGLGGGVGIDDAFHVCEIGA
jgi:hypothetical protein